MNLKVSKNILLTLSGMFVFQSTSLLVALFLSKIGEFNIFGQYQFFISTCSFFILLAKSGIDEKISYSFTGKQIWNINDQKENKIISNLNISFFLSLFASIATVIFYGLYYLFSDVKIDFLISFYAFLYIPPFILVIMISSLFRAQNDILNRTISTYYIPAFFFISFIGFFYYLFDLNIYLFLISRVSTYILAAVFCFWIIYKKFKFNNHIQIFNYKNLNMKILKTLISNWFLFPLICFLFETGTYFVWILRTFNTDEFIGKFSVIFKISSLALIFPLAISIVITPYAVKKFKDKNTLLKERNLIMVTTFISCVFLLSIYTFFGDEIMLTLNSTLLGYKNGLLLLTSCISFIAITSPLQSLMLAQNKVKDVFKINLISILVATIPLFWLSSINDFLSSIQLISLSIFIFGTIRLTYIFKIK